MQNLNKKTIFISIAVIFVLFFVLVLTGLMPGLKKKGGDSVLRGNITLWTVLEENEDEYIIWKEAVLKIFNASYPQVSITRKNFNSIEEYESALLEGFASGEAPDVFMVLNSAMPRYTNKTIPADNLVFSLQDMRSQFPRVVEQDFAPQGKIYGLPLSIDTLAMIYNRNLIDQAAVSIPESWEEFQSIIPKLTRADVSRVEAAGAAFGSSKNIENSSDILSLLMVQTGVQMVNNDFSRATFNSEESRNALEFYTQFSSPFSSVYTWNETMPDMIDMFSQEKVAIIFDYYSSIAKIKSKNSFVDIGVAEIPSPEEQILKNKRVSYPQYFGYVVSRQSKNPDVAWQFIKFLTTNADSAGAYMLNTKKPPALRSFLLVNKNDPNIGVFARQALIAVSWPQIDNRLVESVFKNMILKVNENRATPLQALSEAEDEISRAMEKRF